jgi:hypothetical protein
VVVAPRQPRDWVQRIEQGDELMTASKTVGDRDSESSNRATVAGLGGLGQRRPDQLE